MKVILLDQLAGFKNFQQLPTDIGRSDKETDKVQDREKAQVVRRARGSIIDILNKAINMTGSHKRLS